MTAAIVGAAVGALHGSESLPDRWVEKLTGRTADSDDGRVFELIEQAKEDGVRLILVQPQFDSRGAKTIAEGIGGAVIAIDPIEEDVLVTLRSLADAVEQSRSGE